MKQRGLGLIELAIWAALLAAAVAAAWAAWVGFKHWVAAPYVAEQIAADQQVVDFANKDRDQWKRAAEDRQAETQACVEMASKQTAAVDDIQRRFDKAVADRKAKDAAAKRDNASKEQRIAQLQTAAAAAPQLMKCEDELAKARPILQDVLCIKRPQDPVCVARAGAKTLGLPVPTGVTK